MATNERDLRAPEVLGQLLDHVPIGVVALDAALRVRGWNAHAGQLLARSELDSLGELFCDLLPALDAGLLLRLASNPQARAVVQSNGQELEVSAAPLVGQGGLTETLVVLQDVTARTHAERQREEVVRRLGFLSEASRLLSLELEVTPALERLARHCVSMQADLCLIELVEAEGPVLVALAASHPLLQPALATLREAPPGRLAAEPPLGKSAVLRFEISDQELRQLHGERVGQSLFQGGFRSSITAPLIARGAFLGTLTLIRNKPYDDDDLPLAEEIGRRASVATDNARLFKAEQAARAAAEDSARRTLQLQAVTVGLAGAMLKEQVAQVVLNEGLLAMGAHGCSVALLDEEKQELNILAQVGYRSEDVARSIGKVPLSTQVPIAYAVRERKVVLLGSREEWEARFPVQPIAAAQHQAWAVLPLVLDDRVLGCLGLSYLTPRKFGAPERDFLESLASQCAQALQRAELFLREREARADAEEAVRAREEFISIASHELRTPLTPLMLHLDSLKRVVLGGPLEKRVETARLQTERLAHLVENLLDVARINAGKLHLDREEVELSALVRGVVDRFGPQLERAGCAITVRATAVTGTWDRLRVEQVVSNLLGNAIKYGAGLPIAVTVSQQGDQARLSVKDAGIGIASDALERIFARFERAVSAREYGGLGLGLYITRQIVDALGGTVRAESAPGQGSEFTVELPLSAAAKAEIT